MFEVLECAPQARISPHRVLLRHAYNELTDVLRRRRSAWAPVLAAIVLGCDEVAVPAQTGRPSELHSHHGLREYFRVNERFRSLPDDLRPRGRCHCCQVEAFRAGPTQRCWQRGTPSPSCPKIQTHSRPACRDERMVWRRVLLGIAYRRVSAAAAGFREFRERLKVSRFRPRSNFRTRRARGITESRLRSRAPAKGSNREPPPLDWRAPGR